MACWLSRCPGAWQRGEHADATVARRSGGDLCAGLWGLWQCGARRDTMGFLGVLLACGRALLAMA